MTFIHTLLLVSLLLTFYLPYQASFLFEISLTEPLPLLYLFDVPLLIAQSFQHVLYQNFAFILFCVVTNTKNRMTNFSMVNRSRTASSLPEIHIFMPISVQFNIFPCVRV
ncbi:hypothetical protein B0J11DRAFT_517096 [Dendryphion nanum]|uniref:Uncharacterized protein n=1 Tax=Dendryphion nanum TaxID=256645 RepID=A0A9P9ELC4_9PLEO|nr:hypothetical protein B0J11DRAFT_517096 [Dendryphion nanum]